jgi:hypothetical protein
MCKKLDNQKCYDVFVKNIGINDLSKQLQYLYNLPDDEEVEGIINLYEHIKDKIEGFA